MENEFLHASNIADFSSAPTNWASTTDCTFSSLHQISPYIGKLKPNIARELVLNYTKPGWLVADPFCGSGTIPLEAQLAGRRVVASDDNPYALVLTKAKLCAPRSEQSALSEFKVVYEKSQLRENPDLDKIPAWVQRFFDSRTLFDIVKFADECLAGRHWFLLACLLGILHHQRPGFLSYPSSHLVPYLRDKKFPRTEFPEMYEYRDLYPRMEAKIGRAFRIALNVDSEKPVIRKSNIHGLQLPKMLDAIITSPPYMNALDYRRDNRLRLWLLDRTTLDYSSEPTDKKSGMLKMIGALVDKSADSLRVGGTLVLVVGETVTRKRQSSHPSKAFVDALMATSRFTLDGVIRDSIPDIRRSRRTYQATKAEHVLVLRKTA
jgi:hypothetical protein